MATNNLSPSSLNFTRRNALAALGAGAVMVPTLAAATPLRSVLPADHLDAVLLHHIAEFHRLYREAADAHEAMERAEEAAIARPDCPPLVSPLVDAKGHERWWAFMKAHGEDDYDRWNRLLEDACAHTNVVFSTPAKTIPGVIEKLKIARLAIGDTDQEGDPDLEAFQDGDSLWFAIVIRDLERLSGGAS